MSVRYLLVATVVVASVVAVPVSAGQATQAAEDPSRESAQMAADLGYRLDYDEPPKAERMTKPQYPRRAFEACVEGTVVVLIGIDAEGSVSASKVVQSRDGLDEAAVACVKKWRFKPARKAGVAVGTVALAPIGFRIYDKHKGPGPCTASPGGSQEKPTPRQP